ncbi:MULTISPECIES: UvrD-helicase domain-containing protein [Actinoalloteichus]|uniref:UvrD-like helicase C-terminal domain/UvrD/REP helicase N-terminal domain n=1 Tax=Actinoalloteichus fjordicus TaxID=1612552 RepID=A0AAC9LEP9_9PSEU|nr:MULTISPECIES: UvrD-helicase domain-containing protein [Actinoalloteichus]APU16306.1 UvrD-like helicase C-terminal domain/UvrD/REP helicase N-terminal domain [Actinoalloteichus fjordicus]APU22365.1 UvrD-like helicase C-terminal domain/UvrD/REP helicase N-terminal domain [Actinoalloteichus sp. GBA129-24]
MLIAFAHTRHYGRHRVHADAGVIRLAGKAQDAQLRRLMARLAELSIHHPPRPAWQRRVLSAFLARYALGWRLLLRRQPEAGRADALLIGPAGVFAVVFAAETAEPATGDRSSRRLPPGSPREQASVARHAEEAMAGIPVLGGRRLAGAAVRLVSIADSAAVDPPRSTGTLLSLDERTLDRLFTTDSPRLRRAEVQQIAEEAARRLPDHDLVSIVDEAPAPESDALFDADTAHEAARSRAVSGPFASWLTFLDSRQIALVERVYSGPARISGPAGTGKTVVALHRLARLARRSQGRLLFTTFVASLPKVHQRSFEQLAPEVADRVEFVSLHRWARRLLGERGRPPTEDQSAVENSLARAWSRLRADGLESLAPLGYWRTEIDRVIKGRGLTSLAQYQGVHRRGRRVALTPDQRAQVWALYEQYQRNLLDHGVHDYNDLLSAALAEIRRRPLDPPYSAVVVDEVQDVVLLGLRLLHALVGDQPNGLLLVGDGQQQVYAGGWRLSDAGIPVQGRGEILRTNYRNSAGVVDYARKVDAVNQVDDLDGAAGFALRDVVVAHPGGRVDHWAGPDHDFDPNLVAAVRAIPIDDAGDVAVLAATVAETRRMFRALADAGIAVSHLDRYDGTQTDTVKVGTVLRAKGLEFSSVFWALGTVGDVGLGDQVRRERAEQAERQRLVAATRARDYLWVGRVTAGDGPSAA